jgi:hypothetical protein
MATAGTTNLKQILRVECLPALGSQWKYYITEAVKDYFRRVDLSHLVGETAQSLIWDYPSLSPKDARTPPPPLARLRVWRGGVTLAGVQPIRQSFI